MNLRIQHAEIHLIDLRTRLPAKYGIVTMTGAPHAFIQVWLESDARLQTGMAADNLPPKWFKKDPNQRLEEETAEMLAVIERAVSTSIGLTGESAFDLWRQLDAAQRDWGRSQNLPPLLTNFGTSLVERAIIEAVCKLAGVPFADALRADLLGVDLGTFDDRLDGVAPTSLLPRSPRRRAICRHTVGMADPLVDNDIPDGQRLDDGLPQSLSQCIQRYGLKHFKVKISGDCERDGDRLRQLAEVLEDHVKTDLAWTIDGNECFQSLGEFRDYWERLIRTQQLQALFTRLLFVEQPLHREIALNPTALRELQAWENRPRLIIDESESEPDSLARALQLGYHGKGYKNCKGVFRGVAGACLLERLRRQHPGGSFILSGEDLGNVGPVALMQDLAVAASLGIESIERNGHHFFAGLSAFPASVHQQVLEHHRDLYTRSSQGWPTVSITTGEIRLDSVVEAPLGVAFELNVTPFTRRAL